ncbi:MAG: GNAT family N-acetyltransferase [Candidatus Bathyarchaeota archaeon]|nr:GNAT family N-acetyltransferase [Candidatus Bathyarchaeota archaeon]
MRVYSRGDPGLEPFKEAVSRHVRQSEVMGMPYWVFVEGQKPVGVLSVGREPIQLLEPPGTPMAITSLVDPGQPEGVLREFASRALEISEERAVEYALAIFPFTYEGPIRVFKELGFGELDDAYRMTCPLDSSYEPSDALSFVRAGRGDMRRYIELAVELLSGSPDVTLSMALKNFLAVPEDFLDFYYSQEEFYFADVDGRTVGILNLNPGEGLISNIGVDPSQRGRGYGRQIMLFGLKTLKERGLERARLRVHVDNKPAVRLYESLGFDKSERYVTLIWRKPKPSE